MTEIKAKLNYLRMSPRKVRSVVDLIRGKNFIQAMGQLKFVGRRAALPILKLLKSGASNAKIFDLKESDLYVKKITVDEGTPLKRFRPRAMGRAFQIKKRTSNITLILDKIIGSQKIKKQKIKDEK